MNKPTIIRKRFVPDEVLDISSDEMLFRSDELIVTKWKTIKPKEEFAGGISFTFLKRGHKISKIFNHSNEFMFWYCDIVNVDYNSFEDKYVITDLLVDVKIMPDGNYIVMDLGELGYALKDGIITVVQASEALSKLDKLLETIYRGEFPPEICLREEWYR